MSVEANRGRLITRGSWPDSVTLRRGWARAEARPWNGDHAEASMRLLRGGSPFLSACTDTVTGLGATGVLSPPLPTGAQKVWRRAGYEVFLKLALLRLDLMKPIPTPSHLVVEAGVECLDRIAEIDAAAFDSFWRLDHRGLTEAVEATKNARLLIIRDADGQAAGFAIVGLGSAIAYLQRVAVHPDWQGNGMGRSLVRVAGRIARSHGANAVLLNTQYDNDGALALYEAEGYRELPEPLALLRI
ncbi:MAG: GNAT family N-acetyltransferase [Acidimicrobiia bacterium]|nr:GNAT family N-acetyltransferase [Acidimicrobiia bacterium]NNC74133.1 GNAT family N-acetyltransferase [Acidimicrobiia bacterium]